MRPRRLIVLAGLVTAALGFRKVKLDEADRQNAAQHGLDVKRG
jgi:hypothetical protein